MSPGCPTWEERNALYDAKLPAAFARIKISGVDRLSVFGVAVTIASSSRLQFSVPDLAHARPSSGLGTASVVPIPPTATPRTDGDGKRGDGASKPLPPYHARYICPNCQGSSGGKNLVVCIDGTSNQFTETRNTNVVELYSMLDKSDSQVTFYNSGIGTYAQPSWRAWSYYKQVIANKLDLAFALRFEKIILSAYGWLSENYRDGDRIYLFGFSRGAYQVRVLSAMIQVVGLIYKGNDDQIPFAYELYAAHKAVAPQAQPAPVAPEPFPNIGTPPIYIPPPPPPFETGSNYTELIAPRVPSLAKRLSAKVRALWQTSKKSRSTLATIRKRHSAQEQFKEAFARSVRVHFVGAWDTVSSVGIVRTNSLPLTIDGMEHVCYFRHALALDERRVKFLPEYARGGWGPKTPGVAAPSTDSDAHPQEPHTKEVWFPGCHSDIGGSTEPERNSWSEDGSKLKFGPALRWMSFEALLAGLRLKKSPQTWDDPKATNSLSLFWRLIELLPMKRLTYNRIATSNTATSRWPHLSKRRIPGVHQRIHESAIHLRGNDPVFKRAFLPSFFPEIPDTLIERDPYTAAGAFMGIVRDRLQNSQILDVASDLPKLQALTSSVPGQRSLADLEEIATDRLLNMLQFCGAQLATMSRGPAAIKVMTVARAVQSALFGLQYSFDDNWLPLSNVLEVSTSAPLFWTYPLPLKHVSYPWEVLSVAFLDAEHVVSVWTNHGIGVWNIRTGALEIELPPPDPNPARMLTEDRDRDNAAISADAKKVVSSSFATGALTVRRTGRDTASNDSWAAYESAVAPQAIVHAEVTCAAFSSDSTLIASGSQDGSIRLWNAMTGEAVTYADATSKDSVLIDANATQTPVVLEGHADTVNSLAFFTFRDNNGITHPDSRLVSGASDRTVRIWDRVTRRQVGHLTGHRSSVLSVAVSPLIDKSTLRIASGSSNGGIRIWDAEKLVMLHALEGHHDWVRSVAFSPTGKHLASAADDYCVRLWDVDVGKQVGERIRHPCWVYSVAFSADGSQIVSGARDGSVRIWDRVPVASAEGRI
ncbi:WD40 repeat-like protein [Exidia glandulosa HHB12029]|uniref:WD40 repeat-like protein n=1 Tax=Exidia glandulosa HHB12029 TaxID=1314781 RepID=A0A165CXW3_EXIGL|nr:WD40 repeat-like protein [Exidia glandulosa HHB12029]